MAALTTRDGTLPATYSQALESLALGLLVPIEQAERPGNTPACLFQFNDEPAVRALGLFQRETERRT